MFLWFILAVAAALRLWRLETPSLWFDEVLVAMVAKLPLASVIQRVFDSDIHPPFFHVLTKIVMQAGSSDAALRLPWMAVGLAGVWLSWRAGRAMASERLGLAMAAICAVLPWHVLLSRQLRPYSLIFFFCLLSFFFLVKTLRQGKVRDAVLAGLALWIPILVYYGALLAMGGAGCVLLASWVSGRTNWRHVLAFSMAALVPVATILPFLMAALTHEQGVAGSVDRMTLALLCLEKLSDLLFRENVPWARAALSALSLAGLVLLWRRDRDLALVSLGWLLFPLAALVAAGYGSYFNPWHLTFLMPVLILWLGTALAAVPAAIVPVVLGAAALYFTAGEPFYYNEKSFGGDWKPQARALAALPPGMAFVYPESGVTGPLNWYLDQFASPNPLRAQRLGPQDAVARLVVLGSPKPPRLLARQPVQAIAALPFRTRVTCAPDDILVHVHGLEDVACQPVLENILIATTPRRAGWAEFVYENDSDSPQFVTLHFGYSNRKPGNRFAAMLRFDDEPWAASFESQGPDTRSHDKLELRRGKPYHTLTVRFELRRDGRSPAYTGEDLEAVRFLDFKLEIDSEINS